MKPIHFAALLALGAGACADGAPALQLFQAVSPAANCSIPTSSTGQGSGSLDLTVAEALFGTAENAPLPGYNLGFRVRSNLQETELVVSEAPLTSGGDNTIYLTQMELSYETEPGLDIPAATVPVYTAYQAGDEGGLLTNVLTRDAIKELRTAVTAAQAVQMLVHLRLVGQTAGGTDVESNEVVFPIAVRRSGINFCAPAQYSRELDACENPGQDGFVPECEDAE